MKQNDIDELIRAHEQYGTVVSTKPGFYLGFNFMGGVTQNQGSLPSPFPLPSPTPSLPSPPGPSPPLRSRAP